MSATKELKAFFHWFDNEDPVTRTALDRLHANLPEVCKDALYEASCLIHDRGIGERALPNDGYIGWALDTHPEALRDLSLSLCEALERMREVVPEAKREEFHGKALASFLPDDASQSGKQFWSNLPETDPAKLREQMIANIQALRDSVVGAPKHVALGPFGKDGEVRASAPLPEPRSHGRYPMVYAGSWVDQQQAREQACEHEWYLSAGGAHCLKCQKLA